MRCIALVNEKGGAGKSTLAINIASALTRQGNHVVLVDADPQGTSREWAEMNPPGYPVGFTELDVVRLDTPALLRSLKSISADYIIIDTPAKADDVSATAIRLADVALLPLQPSGADMNAVAPTVKMIHAKRELGGAIEAAFLLNCIDDRTTMTRQARAGAWNGYDLPILNAAVADRTVFVQSYDAGVSVYEMHDPAAIADIDRVMAELKGLSWVA
jgi:chromosome partitioning protein